MLLESHLGMIFKKKTHFVGEEALFYSIKFVYHSLRVPRLMSILVPYIDNLLFETAVPIIIVSNNDANQFREEPIEFLRRQEDSSFNIANTMTELVNVICSHKANKTDDAPVYLHQFLSFCMTNLHQYAVSC